jgi:hypothetical protein
MLNLTKSYPDIFSDTVAVSYNSTTHVFTASGYAENIWQSKTSSKDFDDDGTFDVHVLIDNTGKIMSGANTLTIGGTIPALGARSGTVLTGTLEQFGYAVPSGSVFEFVFDVNGGDLKSQFQPKVGVILTAMDCGFPNNFASNFSTPGGSHMPIGVSDCFPVPEPATASLLLAAAWMGLCRRIRRSRGGSV